MAIGDLDEDERFVLAISLGVLGVILLGAFVLILLDGWIFAYDDRYDDGEEDEAFQYLGDTMMQPSSRNLQPTTEPLISKEGGVSAREAPALPEQPLAQSQTKPNMKRLQADADQEIQQATKAQSQLQKEADQEIQRTTETKASLNAVEVIPTPPKIEDGEEDADYEDHPESESARKRKRDMVKGTVVPRMERVSPPRFLYLSLLISVPVMGYIMYFTALGWGETTFYYMTENYGEYSSLVGGFTALFLVLLYMLDANLWTTRWIKQVCLEVLVIATVLTVLLLTGDYPYGPICCFAAITPLWLISCNQILCCPGRVRTRDYVSSLSGPLFFVSVAVLVAFLVWTFSSSNHEYNRVTKVAYSQATGCVPNLADFPECAWGYVPPPSNAPTTLGDESNSTTRYRLLHDVPAGAVHEPHNGTTPLNDTATPLSDIDKQNNENDENVFTAEETGVCFDTVVEPPAFYLQEGCDPDCPDDVYDSCLNSFILWAGPLLCSMVLFFLSFFCTFLKGDDAEKDIVNFGKLWLFLLFSMWLTASLAGVAAGLSSALVAMTLASFVGSIVFVATTRTTQESKEQGTQFWVRIEENYGAYMDIARGLFLVTCTPFILLYIILSVFNQAFRQLGLPCSKALKTPEQRMDFVTKRTRNQINNFRAWDRTKVLTYAIYWGIAFMVLQVIVSQFTVLFLSWLIEFTSSLNLGIVTAILVGVGMIMFLLPPVPGVPIYLTLGIVVVAVGQETLGIVGSMIYASSVSLALKLLACTVQQKLIGESLAKYTSVRKLVGINTTIIKAMRLVLGQPGMGIDKVCILVGGPDWPTSVLCGIMGLDLLPVLFGTLPVFLLILPTVLTGSFTYMTGLKTDEGELEYPSAAVLGTVFAAVTAVVQFAAMILAAYYLEQTTSNRKEELDAIPIDKEVAELEEAEVAFNEAYDRVTKWPVVPLFMQLVMYVTFAIIVAACYMVQLFGHLCWAEYALTYSIDENLGGKWYNLVLPLGWVAIVLFVLTCLLIYVFISWASVSRVFALIG